MGINTKKSFRSYKLAAKERGFTIVELIVVIVVIAILAAITIVSYNGIQEKAKAAAVDVEVSTIKKKLDTFAVSAGRYPQAFNTSTGQTTPTVFNNEAELGGLASKITLREAMYMCSDMTKEQYCVTTAGSESYSVVWWDNDDKIWRTYAKYPYMTDESTAGNGAEPFFLN